MEGTIGEIRLFAGNFAPRSWAFCNGQIMSIAQNTALFSILGTTYGGNGQTTFALPDLRGRVPVSAGQGPGLANISLGEMAGSAQETLTGPQMPPHGHPFAPPAFSGTADQASPVGHVAATEAAGATATYSAQGADGAMAGGTTGIAGNGQPHNNMPPYLGLNYIICLQGIFPSRN